MEFLKNHYEKVLLSLVLLGLAVVAALLPSRVQEDNGTPGTAPVITNPTNPVRRIPITNDLTTNLLVLQKLKGYSNTVLYGANNLFNPVPWFKRQSDDALIKNAAGDQIGVQALKLVKTTPLYMILSLETVTGSGNNIRYHIGLQREGAPEPRYRYRMVLQVALNGKTDYYTLREVQGPPDKPTNIVVELAGSGKLVNLSKGNPYRQVEAYAGDFRYEPENVIRNGMREQARSTSPYEYTLEFAGDTNIIVAINQTQAVLSAQSTSLRTTIKKQAAP